jgi:inosine-uridine nucleoside N-ribohydrolase
MPKTPVIIDCDPGHDDAMALMLALASPELEVVAVTTVAGNQTLDKVTANAIRVLDVVGADAVPVAAGADRPLIHNTARVADEVRVLGGLARGGGPQAMRLEALAHLGQGLLDTLSGRAASAASASRAPSRTASRFVLKASAVS